MNQSDAIKQPDTAEPGEAPGVVVTYSPADPNREHSHEGVTRTSIARMLAGLKGYDFAGEYDPSVRYPGPVYFIPSEPLLVSEACTLGVRTEDDLFGGVVPYPFVANKTITHPLVDPDTYAPEGWSHGFAHRIRDVVLPGFTVFTLSDAELAGARLLEFGPVRIKRARGTGWRGQIVARDAAELTAALNVVNITELTRHGLILEQNLQHVIAYSVGQIRVAGLIGTYCGTQRETTDNRGRCVYGGSDLIIVRGNYDDLLRLDLTPEVRLAIAQACVYDAATHELPGLLASRRNYDVARGVDTDGRWCSGVLEQSWRMGGASGPEVAALAAFQADPDLQVIRAYGVEVYGTTAAVPAEALVHFRGDDDRLGFVTKYTVVESYVPTR